MCNFHTRTVLRKIAQWIIKDLKNINLLLDILLHPFALEFRHHLYAELYIKAFQKFLPRFQFVKYQCKLKKEQVLIHAKIICSKISFFLSNYSNRIFLREEGG